MVVPFMQVGAVFYITMSCSIRTVSTTSCGTRADLSATRILVLRSSIFSLNLPSRSSECFGFKIVSSKMVEAVLRTRSRHFSKAQEVKRELSYRLELSR